MAEVNNAEKKAHSNGEGFGSVFQTSTKGDGPEVSVDFRKMFWGPIDMHGYQAPNTIVWTVKVSEMFITLKTIDEFQFEVLFHWVQDSPIAAANDHNWADDVHFNFAMFTNSGAHITTFTRDWRRLCGKQLYEKPGIIFASQVAWPVRNLGYQSGAMLLSGYHRQQVTGC